MMPTFPSQVLIFKYYTDEDKTILASGAKSTYSSYKNCKNSNAAKITEILRTSHCAALPTF